MSERWQCIDNQRGFVSVMVLLVVGLLLAIGTSLLAVSSSELQSVREYQKGVTAQYLAEAGSKRALLDLEQGGPASVRTGETLLGAGKYSVSFRSENWHNKITAVGIIEDFPGISKNQVTQKQMFLSARIKSPYRFVAFAGRDITVRRGTIAGSVGANKKARIGYGGTISALSGMAFDTDLQTTITDNVSAHDSIAVNATGSIGGSQFAGFYPLAPLSGMYRDVQLGQNPQTKPYDRGSGNSWTGPASLGTKIYYYGSSSPLVINKIDAGVINGPGVIYSVASVRVGADGISNSETVTVLSNVILLSEQDIIIERGINLNNVILLAGNDIDVCSAAFSGSMVAMRDVYLGGMKNNEESHYESVGGAFSNPLLTPPEFSANSYIVEAWSDKPFY